MRGRTDWERPSPIIVAFLTFGFLVVLVTLTAATWQHYTAIRAAEAAPQTRYPACVDLVGRVSGEGWPSVVLRSCDRTEDCWRAVNPGEAEIIDVRYGRVLGCIFWKAANQSEASWIVRAWDTYESHPPDVVYKTTGEYPVYWTRIVSGGCPPWRENFNCQD